MTAAKRALSDVFWLQVELRPVTRCEPPEGARCYLELGSTVPTAAEAKRHARDYPGHYVVRDQTTRSTYVLDKDGER